MKLLPNLPFRAFKIMVLVFLFGCLPPHYRCERCEEVYLKVGFINPDHYIDSIVYIPQGTKIFYTDKPQFRDTLETFLRLNQLDTISSFVIYSSLNSADTVVFTHSFEVQYDDRCKESFFDLNWIELEYISAKEYLWNPNETYPSCAGTLEIYY